MVTERISPLDEEREVSEGAVLHDQMDVCGGLMAVNQSNDVWVVEAFEDVDFGAEVLLEFLVELGQVDGFDGDVGAMPLESSC
jgi:hypothetical protein